MVRLGLASIQWDLGHKFWMDDEDKRKKLLDDLYKNGEEFVSDLVKDFHELKNPNRRKEPLYLIGAVGAIGAEEFLSESLFDESTVQEIIALTDHPKAREEAAFALLGLEIARKRGEFTPYILKVFDETHTKDLAAHLGKITGDERVVESLIGALNERFIEVEITGLTTADYYNGPALYACQSLLANGDERGIDSMVMALLQKKESNVPDGITTHNKKLFLVDPGRQVLQPLISALSSEDLKVRAQAAFYLGEIGDPAAFESLAQCITSTTDGDLISKVSTALFKLGDPRAIPVLLPTLTHKDMLLRADIKNGLKRLKNVWTPEPFIDALGHEDPRVALFSINALKELKDKGAIEPLSELLDHEDKKVKKQAQKAIKVLQK